MELGKNYLISKKSISRKLLRILSFSLLMIMIIGSAQNVRAEIVWYEEFEDLNNWDVYGWDITDDGPNVEFAHGFIIVNGA